MALSSATNAEPCLLVVRNLGAFGFDGFVRRLAQVTCGHVSADWRAQPPTRCADSAPAAAPGAPATCDVNQRFPAARRMILRPLCGRAFQARRRDVRWCLPACRERAYKQLRRARR